MAVVDPATVSVLVQAAGLAIIAGIQKSADVKRERAKAETDSSRAEAAAWRQKVDERMDTQDERIESILEVQCSQMRSDIIHKCHRYIDDLQCASLEEKDALKHEYKDYERICKANKIKNEFISQIVDDVMELPNRPDLDR